MSGAHRRKWYPTPFFFILNVRCILPVVACLVAVGCSSALRWTPDYYVVQPGDTLYSIAFGYRIDQRDLATWNNLGDGTVIYAGQRIKMFGPAGQGQSSRVAQSSAGAGRSSGAAAKAVARPRPVATWQWPTDGAVVSAYGASSKTQSGIHIAGHRGQAVRAAAAGEIVYSGSGLAGYGQLLIIKHNEDFLSAYGHNDSLVVIEGERVTIGQRIARMGNGPGQRPLLHFEIRRNGQPVDPVKYLPRR